MFPQCAVAAVAFEAVAFEVGVSARRRRASGWGFVLSFQGYGLGRDDGRALRESTRGVLRRGEEVNGDEAGDASRSNS